jgi:hypothetical protein
MQHTPLFLMLDARVHCLRDPRTASTRAHPRNVDGDSVAEARGPSFFMLDARVHCLRDPRTASTRAHPRNFDGDSVAEARGY